MRIGIFGGSFDPVHVGHLWIAEAASETLALDRLLWVPSATQPLKPDGPSASGEQRLAMLRLAVGGRPGHEIDDRELRRSGVSYTIDTVDALQHEHESEAAEFFLVLGSDSLASMPLWHQPEQLLSRVTLAVVRRGGEAEIAFSVLSGMVDQDRIDRFAECVIEMPLIELSSSEIRSRVRRGLSIRHRVPRAVEAYIGANGVYRT